MTNKLWTDDDQAEGQKVCEAAPEGPWEVSERTGYVYVLGPPEIPEDLSSEEEALFQAFGPGPGVDLFGAQGNGENATVWDVEGRESYELDWKRVTPQQVQTLEFAAYARTALPRLLEAWARLERGRKIQNLRNDELRRNLVTVNETLQIRSDQLEACEAEQDRLEDRIRELEQGEENAHG